MKQHPSIPDPCHSCGNIAQLDRWQGKPVCHRCYGQLSTAAKERHARIKNWWSMTAKEQAQVKTALTTYN